MYCLFALRSPVEYFMYRWDLRDAILVQSYIFLISNANNVGDVDLHTGSLQYGTHKCWSYRNDSIIQGFELLNSWNHCLIPCLAFHQKCTSVSRILFFRIGGQTSKQLTWWKAITATYGHWRKLEKQETRGGDRKKEGKGVKGRRSEGMGREYHTQQMKCGCIIFAPSLFAVKQFATMWPFSKSFHRPLLSLTCAKQS